MTSKCTARHGVRFPKENQPSLFCMFLSLQRRTADRVEVDRTMLMHPSESDEQAAGGLEPASPTPLQHLLLQLTRIRFDASKLVPRMTYEHRPSCRETDTA